MGKLREGKEEKYMHYRQDAIEQGFQPETLQSFATKNQHYRKKSSTQHQHQRSSFATKNVTLKKRICLQFQNLETTRNKKILYKKYFTYFLLFNIKNKTRKKHPQEIKHRDQANHILEAHQSIESSHKKISHIT